MLWVDCRGLKSIAPVVSEQQQLHMEQLRKQLPSFHLFNQHHDSLIPRRLGSHAWLPGSRPRRPVRGSVIHHTPGGHVFWKGRELVTSLSQLAWMSSSFFFSCVPFLCSFPGLLLHWNNWAAFSATRLPAQRLNSDIELGATTSPWLPFRSSFLRLPPRSWRVIIVTPASRQNGIRGTLSTVAGPPWSCVYRPFFQGLLSVGSLDSACSTWHTFKTVASRGFYSSNRIQSLFSLVFLPLHWVIQSLMREGR